MEQNAELRLPTIAVPVTLSLVGGTRLDGEVFVADAGRGGRDRLLDALAALLDEDALFVPVRQGPGVRLYAKHAIAWVAARRREESDEELDDSPSDVITLYDRQHRVEIALLGGTRFAGSLFDSSPADRPRVIDHLNRAGRFVRLWTPTDQTLINTAQIESVSEQE